MTQHVDMAALMAEQDTEPETVDLRAAVRPFYTAPQPVAPPTPDGDGGYLVTVRV